MVYFYSVGSDLPWSVLNWRLDLELTDMKTIIEMAREAGAAVGSPALGVPEVIFTHCLDIYRFATLVRADEREACALIGDSMDSLQDGAIGRAIRSRGQA